MRLALDLVVVLPVFNEAASVGSVLNEWFVCLKGTEIDFLVLALDDGSTDETPTILQEARKNWGENLEVLRHENIGHGQTCLRGYRWACNSGARYVLQIDSDGQCDPSDFAAIWKMRKENDIVFGIRAKRDDGWQRSLVSSILRLLMRTVFKIHCPDVNTPFRLMKASRLVEVVDSIPADFTLANIALAVQLEKLAENPAGLVEIGFRQRLGGKPSVPFSRFGFRAIELFRQLKALPPPRQYSNTSKANPREP